MYYYIYLIFLDFSTLSRARNFIKYESKKQFTKKSQDYEDSKNEYNKKFHPQTTKNQIKTSINPLKIKGNEKSKIYSSNKQR